MLKSVFGRLLVCHLALAAIFAPCARAAPSREVLFSWKLGPANPTSGLIKATNGNFYGTSPGDGVSAFGTVFKMTPAGKLTTLVYFTGGGATNKGSSPQAALVQGTDGNFYGTTAYGGIGFVPGSMNSGYGNGTTVEGGDGGGGTVFRLRFGPTPVTLAASGVVFDGATLNGTVKPNGLATTFHFEYGLTTAYGTSTANQSAGVGTSAVAVQAAISGLASNKTWHFRIVATNGEGTAKGGDLTFTTARPPPTATTLVASSVTSSAATLGGSVNPNGLATNAHFQYGLTTAYGTSTANQTAGAGTSAVAVQAVLGNLTPNTFYHYRLVATNRSGTANGLDRTFTTLDNAELAGTWAERTLVRILPTAVGKKVDIGTLTFNGGTGSIETSVNATGPGWSVAKRYVIPIGYNVATGFPAATWLKVLPTHDTGAYGVNDFDLDVNVSGATALLRLRTVGSNGNVATARISIKTTGLQTFVNSTAAAAVAAPAQRVVANAVDELNGKAGIGVAPAGSAVLDVNGGDTRGLHLHSRSIPGTPATGIWNKGTIILDSAGDLFICTTPGNPGTWKKVGAP